MTRGSLFRGEGDRLDGGDRLAVMLGKIGPCIGELGAVLSMSTERFVSSFPSTLGVGDIRMFPASVFSRTAGPGASTLDFA